MLNYIFDSVYSQSQTNINPGMLLLSIGASLLLGIILAATYKYKTLYTKEFVITITLLPTLIAIIIFLVNGNLGTSVAVAGTFSLIRFRSAAGGAKEILSIFIATAIGIATGMGFLLLATVITILLCIILVIFENSDFTTASQTRRQVIITVPDNIDYEFLLEGIFVLTAKADWAKRLEKGVDTLHTHSAKGFGKMPAQATGDVSEAEVYAAVDYMISQVKK